ncbi:hypothetical protein BGZ65_011274 [Modicella reniformis]|uniref:Myb-like domain-containing protein n=1 Tax=Modicella reniformis TaxID=1440133 RepID=A0A9P6IT43_9FUNG|nr:hypothetical protein BGZ65_011274 [Modicella reniformis]
MGAIRTRMCRVRQSDRKEVKEVKELPQRHQPGRSKKWTLEEDQWLKERVMDFWKGEISQDTSFPSSVWKKIESETVDGKRLGRCAITCKRRWDIINPFSRRIAGRWMPDEEERFVDALREQMGGSSDGGNNNKKELFDLEKLAKVEWGRVSSKVGTRSDVQCRSHMYKTFLTCNHGHWDASEVARLVRGLAEHGIRWNKLHHVVKTRSAFQIKNKYYNSMQRVTLLARRRLTQQQQFE